MNYHNSMVRIIIEGLQADMPTVAGSADFDIAAQPGIAAFFHMLIDIALF